MHLLNKGWDSGLQRFKVIIAGNHDAGFKDPITHEKFYDYIKNNGYDESFTPERIAAVFLAHTMNTCRKIIEGQPEFLGTEIDMASNICMPIDHIQNNIVKSEFEKVFSLGGVN